MDLKQIALELREILENKRQELELTFIEDTHTYFMKDVDGVVKNNFPSVSKVLKKFYPEFPTNEAAEKKSKGDPVVKQQLIEEWAAAGDYSTNMGSRVHFFLEKKLIDSEIEKKASHQVRDHLMKQTTGLIEKLEITARSLGSAEAKLQALEAPKEHGRENHSAST